MPAIFVSDPLSTLSDNDLVRLARLGNMAAFEALFCRHEDGLYREALRLSGDPGVAMLLVVRVFDQARLSLPWLRSETEFRNRVSGCLRESWRCYCRERCGPADGASGDRCREHSTDNL